MQGKHGRSNSARAHSNHSSLSLFNRRLAIKLPNLGIRLFASTSLVKALGRPDAGEACETGVEMGPFEPRNPSRRHQSAL